jgi:hypothetical protein
MSGLEFDLDERDDIEFVHQLRLIVAGVLLAFQPREVYLVKIDNWFGDRWLGFSHKLMGAAGVHYRHTLRVPPFVPARVVYERHFRRVEDGEYVAAGTMSQLHVEQSSEANARRLMSAVCANAAVFWWSGETRANQRGALMAYLPTSIGTHRDRATEAQITRGPARRVPGHVVARRLQGP